MKRARPSQTGLAGGYAAEIASVPLSSASQSHLYTLAEWAELQVSFLLPDWPSIAASNLNHV
jgi:hypothetical protein